MKTIRKLLNKAIRNYWKPVKCGWPYPPGYACYNKFKHTSIDHGQPTRAMAQSLCDQLNRDLK